MYCKTDKAVELVMAGTTPSEAAKQVGMSLPGLCAGLKRRGLDAPVKGKRGLPKGTKLRPRNSKSYRAIQRVMAGEYVSDVAKELGISHQAIYDALAYRGLKAPKRPPRQRLSQAGRERIAERAKQYRREVVIPQGKAIIAEWKASGSYSAVAAKLGMSRSQVAGIIHRYRRAAAETNGAAQEGRISVSGAE